MKVVKTFVFLLFVVPLVSLAQKTQVKKETMHIDGEQATGFKTELLANEEEVTASLSRFFKTLGKTKNSSDYLTIAQPVIGGKTMPGTLYGSAIQNGKSTTVWIGMPLTSGEESSVDRDLETVMYNFAVTFQREQVQAQIDESLRALQTVEKKQMRLVNQHKDLNNKIENNKKEKIALEKALVDNKVELEDLTNKLAANARAQDSVAVATEQIRKVVEMHRERQRKVQ
ncbi:MAG TPA: hypothetical protein VFT90_07505 [Chryseosolibacter sp.]|nr:hypothetical protein [Chryseosolibacter sp.]